MLNRRQFNRNAVLTTLAAAAGTPTMHPESLSQPETIHLQQNGWMPNNLNLPVLLYRNALDLTGDPAGKAEALFEQNGWPPQWRNGVYTFHHYHSTTHEVLGFTRGRADLVLGGEGNQPIAIHAGDVLVLPTGTGHCERTCTPDFQVIGAYPPHQHWDICRTAPDAAARQRMAAAIVPNADPIQGPSGPLPKLWRT